MRAELSIFQRLLLLVAGAGLVIATVSGVAHHFFTARLMKQSVQGEMETALRASVDYFEAPFDSAARDMRLLESSPLVDSLLVSSGDDELITRPGAERLFLAVIRSRGAAYFHPSGGCGRRRAYCGRWQPAWRNYRNLLEPPGDPAQRPWPVCIAG